MQKNKIINLRCHDCDAKEGEIHMMGCDMEVCPKCKGQLISCDCHTGTTKISEDELHIMFKRKGYLREPYFIKPLICAKCAELYPNFVMYSEEDWEYICGSTFEDTDILCERCMDYIIKKRLSLVSKPIKGKNEDTAELERCGICNRKRNLDVNGICKGCLEKYNPKITKKK